MPSLQAEATALLFWRAEEFGPALEPVPARALLSRDAEPAAWRVPAVPWWCRRGNPQHTLFALFPSPHWRLCWRAILRYMP